MLCAPIPTGSKCGFFEICNANGIEYWLEFGSLLGYVRHKGIIPWKWDMEVGCTSTHFRTLLNVGTAIERDHPLFGFHHYQHPEYGDAGYNFYLKSNPDILCDIAEYRQEGDKLVHGGFPKCTPPIPTIGNGR